MYQFRILPDKTQTLEVLHPMEALVTETVVVDLMLEVVVEEEVEPVVDSTVVDVEVEITWLLKPFVYHKVLTRVILVS